MTKEMKIKSCAECGSGHITVQETEEGVELTCVGCGRMVLIPRNDEFLLRLYQHGQEAYRKARTDYLIDVWNRENKSESES